MGMIDSRSGLGMIALFFVYGLAFFLMGFAILGEVLRTERSRLTDALLFLALFGLVHSAVEWADMFALAVKGFGLTGWDRWLEGLHSVLLPVSLLLLLIFGVKLLADSVEGAWVLWLLPPALLFTWLTVSFLLPIAMPRLVAGDSAAFSQSWPEAWARYLLYLPGSLLAAIALTFQRRLFMGLGMKDIASYASLGAAAFVLNAIVAGLIVPRAPFPPALWVNYDTFTHIMGVPPQLFRALAAIGVAFAMVQMLRFRDLTQHRLLETAHQETYQLQEQARLQAEEWGRTLEHAVRERTQQLEALARINTEISSLLEIGKILDLVVEKACELLRADLVAISLKAGPRGELVVQSVVGNRTPLFANMRLSAGQGAAGMAVAQGGAVVVPGPQGEIDRAEGLVSQLAVPLQMGRQTLGTILVASRIPVEFTPQQVELLSRLASQAAIALEKARLYQQVQDLAIIQERERLAREMHDSLAQVLGYFRLELSQATTMLSAGDTASAAATLEGLDRTAAAAYADVRDAILGLRNTVTQKRDLLTTLRDYLHTFSLQHQIAATLHVTPGIEFHFSPQVEIQVIRIIQEALTNVRKHSGAARVAVEFSPERNGVHISVADNGRGFDPAAVAQDGVSRFGLATMRERAESVGGQFTIRSAPGAGTQVLLWVPIATEKGVEDYEAAKDNGGGRPELIP